MTALIKLMFRYIGKSSKVSAKGTTWTITFIRDVGGPVLITKLLTMSSVIAAQYQEDNNYPISIKEDFELEGLFATVPPPPPVPAPTQPQPTVPENVDPETGEVREEVGEMQTPRRRGRPPGSKNKPKTPESNPDLEPEPEMDPEPGSESIPMMSGPGF